ncbi:MAG TPA: cation:proton antiporter [Solirubrobacterales bacterium]|nr:cation:proton antiporter [Solirubrobacterales bacterium]
MLSTDEILAGLGLVVVLAIGSRLVAERLRIPAIVLLLPVGFVAGAITDDVHPEALLGAAFQPLVSLGVGLILFEAGLRLDLAELSPRLRSTVRRLVGLGALTTFVGIGLAAKLVLGLEWGTAAVLGAILVVSGPTVVLPLLAFVRPTDRVRSLLRWEGTLIDPLGALLGVVALHAVLQGVAGERPLHLGALLGSLAIGAAIGLVAAFALGALLERASRTSPGQAIALSLMAVAAAVVGADLLRDDAGLVAATAMGMALARRKDLDVSRILDFHGTVVELLIGILFVLISASVTPHDVGQVLGGTLALVAIMVFVIRPAAVAIGTAGSELEPRERAFAAWMAPRGIVAGATASSFALTLAGAGIGDAPKLLPIAFVAIFATVVIYGLTAAPVSRLLGVAGTGSPGFLLVGGGPVALAIGTALRADGNAVRVWSNVAAERDAARAAGLVAEASPLGLDRIRLEAELEEIGEALVIGPSDDFNLLAAQELRTVLGRDHVHTLARGAGADALPPHAEGRAPSGGSLTHDDLLARLTAGSDLTVSAGEGAVEIVVRDRRSPHSS